MHSLHNEDGKKDLYSWLKKRENLTLEIQHEEEYLSAARLLPADCKELAFQVIMGLDQT